MKKRNRGQVIDDPTMFAAMGGVALFVFLSAAGFWYYHVRLWQENQETEITRASNQYRTTAESQFNTLIERYNALEVDKAKFEGNVKVTSAQEAQQKAIVNQIKDKAKSVNQVPASVSQFLAAHGEK